MQYLAWMSPLSITIGAVAVLSALVVAWLLTRKQDAPAAVPPPRAWDGDTVTPMIQGRRNKAPERVSRSFVIGQGAILALRMAEVDGEIKESERQAVKQFILTNVTQVDEAMADRAVAQAEAGLKNTIELERAIEGVRAVSSEEQRTLLVDLLVHVAQADGSIHEAEVAFLQRIGGMLGLTDTAVAERIAIDGGT